MKSARQPAQAIESPISIFAKLGWVLVVLGAGALLTVWAVRSWLVLFFPYQVEYGEGPVLDWALTLLSGRWPYKPIQPLPWTFSVYTPGYLLAAAMLTPLAEQAGFSPWLAGRLISLASALGLAVLAVTMARALSDTWWAGVVAAVMWLCSPYLNRWATFYRPDLFALWWSALGIAFVGRARGRPQWLVPGGLALLAGVLTKQSFVAAPLAALFYLWRRDRRSAAVLAASLVVPGLVVGLGLWWTTGGALVESLLVANANPFSPASLWRFEWAFVRLAPVMLLLAAVALRRHRLPLVGLWWLVALPVTLSVGKAGAWENYFLEAFFGATVLAAAVLTQPPFRSLAPWLLLVQLVLFLPGFEHRTPAATLRWLAEREAEERALAEAVAKVPDPVLSEHMGVLAQSRRPVWLHTFVYTQLERQGVFDPTELLDMVRQGEFSLVVQRAGARVDRLKLGRWSQRVLNAVEASYAPAGRAGRWLLLRPAPLNRTASTPVGQDMRLARWDVAVNGLLAPAGPIAFRPGDRLTVHLLWEAVGEPDEDLTAFVHLVDWQGRGLSQHDGPPRDGTAPTSRWRPGDLVRDVHPLQVPAEARPGAYALKVGLYTVEDDGSLQMAGPPVLLGGLKVPMDFTPPSRVTPLGTVGGAITLVALERPKSLRPGQTVTVETVWRVEQWPTAEWTAFLHLVGPCEDAPCRRPPRAQDDHPPLGGRYPTSVWSPGEYVPVRFQITVPRDAPPGTYRLRLGWYDTTRATRLSVAGAAFPVVDEALEIGTFVLEE